MLVSTGTSPRAAVSDAQVTLRFQIANTRNAENTVYDAEACSSAEKLAGSRATWMKPISVSARFNKIIGLQLFM
jgi:hypothetical protein